MPAKRCGELRTIAWTGEQEGDPTRLGIRYSRAHRCWPCMMAIARRGKGVLPGQIPIREGPAQDLPTVGVRTWVRTVRTHVRTESAISPRPASALCLRGSCALWAVRTGSGGGSHWPPESHSTHPLGRVFYPVRTAPTSRTAKLVGSVPPPPRVPCSPSHGHQESLILTEVHLISAGPDDSLKSHIS